MFLGLLTLITALTISAVAIYYSVAGLVAIFAAAALPIMIMGGVLEVSKLVTAVWLHRYWKQATWWLKTYLTTAVVVLMFITSMGIFGFLSKAHIEQTASATEGVAQIQRIEAEIARNEEVISRAENKIRSLETSGTGVTTQLQEQINIEQQRIDSAYERIQPAIDEQNAIIANQTKLFQSELDKIDADLAKLQGYIDAGEIAKAQGMVGSKADGAYGPKTAAAFTAYQDRKAAEREQWLQRIQSAQQSDVVLAAREEIKRLRATAEAQIAESNALINNIREQLKSNSSNDLQTILDEQNERVRTASSEIDQLFDEKFRLEAEYRKLEAEVGPIKYIAEFVYGEQATTNLLEEAVRWVILVIIFVFDPLAVLLLIASQYTFEIYRKRKDDEQAEKKKEEWKIYEQARAQKIIDNASYNFNATSQEEKAVKEFPEAANQELFDEIEKEEQENVKEDPVNADGDSRTLVSENAIANSNVSDVRVDKFEISIDDDPESDTEEERERRRVYDELDSEDTVKSLKQRWKLENPNENLKVYKKLYIQGKIENLPWLEDYKQDK